MGSATSVDPDALERARESALWRRAMGENSELMDATADDFRPVEGELEMRGGLAEERSMETLGFAGEWGW